MRLYEIETPNELTAAFNNAADDDGWDTGAAPVVSNARSEVVNQEQQLMAMYKLAEEKIKTYCAPYIQAVGGIERALFTSSLFRGVRPEEVVYMDMTVRNPIHVIDVRQDRVPTDTPLDVSHMVDDWFQRETGYRFRSQSLFTTGRRATASAYGWPVVVLPVGEFHFCWSREYKDMYQDMSDYAQARLMQISSDSVQITNKKNISKYFGSSNEVDEFMRDGGYRFDTDLQSAIASSHEVMIVCSKAIILDSEWLKQVDFQLLHNT